MLFYLLINESNPSSNFLKIVMCHAKKKIDKIFLSSLCLAYFFSLHGQTFEILNCLAAYGSLFNQEVIFFAHLTSFKHSETQ